ncbi:FAD-dependent oxidoreductase [Bacillus clarus]|uniref:FAD binding domain protein n=1 Tax=Bacillus clarus TaxID=2338372 RepID=A0A090YZQ3_9BACI|nr:FAD-dependent oxidoreductase [Bacillus clarus]KFN03872.1 FAD binding domain protein [Bacillus clarus]RFT64310.1 FAD-dependent oxidoreductase [Bacillus clarus]
MTNNTYPKFPSPYWIESATLSTFPHLSENIKTEVVIIGAGITGITTAYLLAKEGMKVVLIDSGRILNGTTGHTTAKVTAQHDLIYDELINHFGIEKAHLYYEANDNALQFIKDTVQKYEIDCDFTNEDSYLYTTTTNGLRSLTKEYEAYQKLNIPCDYVQSLSIPIPIQSALVMKNQAQFHPLLYLKTLVENFIEMGGIIYEQTTAIDVEKGFYPQVITKNGQRITCGYVVSCSHFPFYDANSFFFARMYAERSYVLAVKAKTNYPGGMYLSIDDPKRSLRYATINGEKLILIGGESHKTGQGINTMLHYEALHSFAEGTFGIDEIPYRWSAQDLITLDKLPYIGHINENNPNIFVATGYRKWGMTTGTVAAHLLKNSISKIQSPYKELFAPSRFHANPDIKTFLSQNIDVAKHLIEGKIEVALRKPEDLEIGEGAVVRVHGKRAGAYKDEEGKLHIVDTTCTHLGCEVEWNNGDCTWDCPCHGSRFSIDGAIIEGPADKPLKRVDSE